MTKINLQTLNVTRGDYHTGMLVYHAISDEMFVWFQQWGTLMPFEDRFDIFILGLCGDCFEDCSRCH